MEQFSQLLFVFQFEIGDGHWSADPDHDFTGPDKQFAFGQDVVRTDEADGDHRDAGLYGQGYGTGFKWLQSAVGTAGSFGKDKYRGAPGYLLGGPVQAFHRLSAVGAVNGNDPGTAHGRPEERNAKQFFFGDPAEIVREKALKAEDIKLAGMIADKDIRLLRHQVFRSDNSDPNSRNPADSCPPGPGKNLDPELGFPDQVQVDQG